MSADIYRGGARVHPRGARETWFSEEARSPPSPARPPRSRSIFRQALIHRHLEHLAVTRWFMKAFYIYTYWIFAVGRLCSNKVVFCEVMINTFTIFFLSSCVCFLRRGMLPYSLSLLSLVKLSSSISVASQ